MDPIPTAAPTHTPLTQTTIPSPTPLQQTQQNSKPRGRSNLGVAIGVIILIISMGFISGYLGYIAADLSLNGTLTRSATNQTITQVRQAVTVDETSGAVDVAKNSTPSVVSIVAYENVSNTQPSVGGLFGRLFGFSNGANGSSSSTGSTTRQESSAGSGFIVTDNGYVLSNRHVVESTTAEYEVVLNDGTKLAAKVIDRDTYLDIAVVKVESPNKLTPVKMGDSDALKVGQIAIAIGNSLGEFSNTVSKGIISGLDRSIQASDTNGTNAEQLDHIIQTDASINSGNSGGPLLDIQGNVIAVNVAKASNGENVGFAIPINDVKQILESAIKTGRIVRPYIGVQYIDLTPEINKIRGLGYDYGAYVFSDNVRTRAVVAGSPADKAGIKDGDILLEINGEKIQDKNSLRRLVQKYNVGDTIKIKYARDGKEAEVNVTLAALPKN